MGNRYTSSHPTNDQTNRKSPAASKICEKNLGYYPGGENKVRYWGLLTPLGFPASGQLLALPGGRGGGGGVTVGT